MSYNQKLDALKQLSTSLAQKEDIPDSLWDAAGFTAESKKKRRLKEVEQEIVAIKKKISVEMKDRTNKTLEKEAEDLGISVDEMIGKVKKEKGIHGTHQQDKRSVEDAAKAGREKKLLEAAVGRGDYDLERDFV